MQNAPDGVLKYSGRVRFMRGSRVKQSKIRIFSLWL